MDKTPRELGYRMPAEWEPHEATWLSWPHDLETWPQDCLKSVEEAYLQIIEVLLRHERVHLLVADAEIEEKVSAALKQRKVSLKNFVCHKRPTADIWIRDYGPVFLKNREGKKAWCKWDFNAWGGRYAYLVQDRDVFGEENALLGGTCFRARMVLEGGSIEVNGEGACLTSEECLLNKNRNPGLSKAKIEERLKDYLGVTRIVWLGRGIAGDDTDGHVDNIARFTASETLVAAFEEDTRDENYPVLRENWERLCRSGEIREKKWDLVKLPMPGRMMLNGRRLPASYANFYIANHSVLLPTYRDSHDETARSILKELFPEREVFSIPCRDLILGLGSIHCITQQEPA